MSRGPGLGPRRPGLYWTRPRAYVRTLQLQVPCGPPESRTKATWFRVEPAMATDCVWSPLAPHGAPARERGPSFLDQFVGSYSLANRACLPVLAKGL